MPFTPSHIAAVLPLRSSLGGALPFAALAIGSMSPDLPYYLPGVRGLSALTHTAWAVPSLDVGLGLIAWLLWRWLAPAVHELAPATIRRRWRLPSARPRWWDVALALAIGAATHVFIDEFTHAGRFGATHLAVLAASYPSPLGGSWEGYRWAQYLGGAVGLLIIAWAAWRTPPEPVAPGTSRWWQWVTWIAAAAAMVGAGLAVILAGGPTIGVRALVFASITGGIGSSAAVVAGFAVVHRIGQYRVGESASSTTPAKD